MNSGSSGAIAPNAINVHTTGADARCASSRGERRGLRGDHPAAKVKHRTLRVEEQVRERGDAIVLARAHLLPSSRLRQRILVDRDARALHVLRHIDCHRARTAGFRNRERERHHLEQLLGGTHEEVMLRDRQRESVGVDLLERVGADHALRHLAGDRHQGHRIEARVGDRREEIGRARAGRAERHRGAAGDAGHALGDETRALFVAREHVADTAAMQRIVEWQDRPARNARDRIDPLAFEQDAQEVGSVGLHDDWLAW